MPIIEEDMRTFDEDKDMVVNMEEKSREKRCRWLNSAA